MKPLMLARFTPSLTDPEDLEAIFVQRQALAERLLDQFRDSITTEAKHHNLLVGPRGIGKTHLLTLVHHRLVKQPDLRSRRLIAWLREDEWGVMSFLDLLLRILRALAQSKEAELPAEEFDALHDLTPARAEKKAAELLRRIIGDKTLVLLMENLDDIFRGMARREQSAFRAFLQDHACVTILATSPSLFDGVSDRKFPFFGFFRILHLTEFGFEDAAELLAKIAKRRGQDDLASFIRSPIGRARVRAVHHLAQGNPRVYVILSEFLTRQSLDDLVEPVVRMLDDLTPYYQSRLQWLSMQQRKIVEFLASHRIPAVVKEVARRCFISQQTCSSQLRKLAEWGYVRSESVGRESYYELREPLMRFCLDLKKERKEPLRPLVEILRLWWTPDELTLQLHSLKDDKTPMAEYLTKALQQCRVESSDPREAACQRDCDRHRAALEFEKALLAAEDLLAIAPRSTSYWQRGLVLFNMGRWQAAREDFREVVTIEELTAPALTMSAWCNFKLDEYTSSISESERALAILNVETQFPELVTKYHVIASTALASSLEQMGRPQEAIDGIAKSIGWESVPALLRVKARCLILLSRHEEAKSCLLRLMGIVEADGFDWLTLGMAHDGCGASLEGIKCMDRAISLGDKNAGFYKVKMLAEAETWNDIPAALKSAASFGGTVNEWQRIVILDVISRAWTSRESGGILRCVTEINQILAKRGIAIVSADELAAYLATKLAELPGDHPNIAPVREVLKILDGTSKSIAFAILEAAMVYLDNHDPSSLLGLPLEERKLIEDAFARSERIAGLFSKKPN